MLNLASRYRRCSSLKRYAFFVFRNAHPSGGATDRSAAVEMVAEIVGSALSPSCSVAAYFIIALSMSVSLSTDLVHLPNVRCFSKDECL